jgi:hypothetical protein
MAFSIAEKRAAGKEAILLYHNEAKQWPDYPYKTSVEQLYTYIESLSPDWLTKFGNTILVSNYSKSMLKTVMENLGYVSEGKIPPNAMSLQLFGDVMQYELTTVSANVARMWVAVKDTVTLVGDTAKIAVTGFAAYKIVTLVVAGLGALTLLITALKRKA